MATKRKLSRKSKPAGAATRSGGMAISPCLWFASEAEEAARFYVSIFKGKISQIARYPGVGQEIHHGKAGSVMTVEFTMRGVKFLALNGGPIFKFNEAVSLQVFCKTQKEIDYYWEKLGQGGDPKAQACGWLKDRYGLSWQIVPEGMGAMLKDHKSPKTERAFAAMMDMKKLDIAALKAAYAGK